MGFISDFFSSVGEIIVDTVELGVGLVETGVEFVEDLADLAIDAIGEAVDFIGSNLSKKIYKTGDINYVVDIDAELAEFKEKIIDPVDILEKNCMQKIDTLFSGLKDTARERFPDLIEIIEKEQENTKDELNGTIMRYVNEHFSLNNDEFLKVLKMKPGDSKKVELERLSEKVLDDAGTEFSRKLKEYAEYILNEFTIRLAIRIKDHEYQMNSRIEELEMLKKKAASGKIDIDELKEKSAPLMESSQCIIQILEMGLC